MDELTLLHSTRDDTLAPSEQTLAVGRQALLARVTETVAPPRHIVPRRRRRPLRRATWVAAGTATLLAGVLIAGPVDVGVQSARASEILREAAAAAQTFSDPSPQAGQYLLVTEHSFYPLCQGLESGEYVCSGTNEEILRTYVPFDRSAEWVQVRDWGNFPGRDEPLETLRAAGAEFYGPGSGSMNRSFDDVPLDGAAAYDWIHAQYVGGSSSHDEDDFVRITDLLRTGVVPAPQRAALLDALSRIPGVTSTAGVANLDGVAGVAIGRDEPLRLGDRQEILIDPATGLVIGERTVSGTKVFGWGVGDVVRSSAVSTTVVDEAP